jgi:hypothetical protein
MNGVQEHMYTWTRNLAYGVDVQTFVDNMFVPSSSDYASTRMRFSGMVVDKWTVCLLIAFRVCLHRMHTDLAVWGNWTPDMCIRLGEECDTLIASSWIQHALTKLSCDAAVDVTPIAHGISFCLSDIVRKQIDGLVAAYPMPRQSAYGRPYDDRDARRAEAIAYRIALLERVRALLPAA